MQTGEEMQLKDDGTFNNQFDDSFKETPKNFSKSRTKKIKRASSRKEPPKKDFWDDEPSDGKLKEVDAKKVGLPPVVVRKKIVPDIPLAPSSIGSVAIKPQKKKNNLFDRHMQFLRPKEYNAENDPNRGILAQHSMRSNSFIPEKINNMDEFEKLLQSSSFVGIPAPNNTAQVEKQFSKFRSNSSKPGQGGNNLNRVQLAPLAQNSVQSLSKKRTKSKKPQSFNNQKDQYMSQILQNQQTFKEKNNF